jgi:dienelactone hydrolase
VRVRLVEASKAPAGTVAVSGGEYRLASYYRPSEQPATLKDFFIDRTEVSNRDFEAFVRDGGYRRPELWKHPFADAGKTLTFDQAMARFHDATGLPGPREWRGGAPLPGREDHPVTGVTWYEAAAFAEWKGRKLPTIYQWERAARPRLDTVDNVFPWGAMREGTDATERSNFLGGDTVPVDSMPFGASPVGALHMAGNVSEWCRNVHPPGYAARGGSFRDAMYAFGQTAALPGFYTAPTLGFRCVVSGDGDEGDIALNPSGDVPVYKPVDDAKFAEFRKRYEYPQTPLNARVVERVEAADWTREKITFDVNGKVVPAYLYLPKGFKPPFQTIQFAPAGDVTAGLRTVTHSIEIIFPPLIRAGRAVFSVELEGFIGRPRPPGFQLPARDRDEWVEYTVGRVTEMRRGLDYLMSRPDIDHDRVALIGISAGGGPGVFATALESRYRAVVFAGTGIARREIVYAPAANRINFVPRIKGPTLMVQGRYDEDTSLKSEAEPLFRLLPEPKRIELYDGPHVAPIEFFIPKVTNWLDEKMGKV